MTLRAATYYVDSGNGSDSNSGTSQNAPWKSLAKVNATEFSPGDRVLFRSGAAWKGELVPRGSGREGAPIVLGRYGAGALPHIDADGQFEDAVRLKNVQFIELRDLELTNHGPVPAARRGVHIFLDNFGTARHIVITGLYIHDVNGSNGNGDTGKDNGGIIFRTRGDQKPSRFDGLTIERNVVWKVDRSGIAAESYHWRRTRWFPSLHVLIRDNLVDDIGGDGIVPWATDGAVIEHNIALNCNRRAGSYNAGIWPWSTDNSLFQLNEAAFTRTTLDGEGFDSDFNSRHTLFQYNYSHDNEGGFMLICTPGKVDKDNIGNVGTEVRYNISRNDHARGFNLSAASQTVVHDNAIYVGNDIDLQMLITTDWDGWANGATFRNNFFYVAGTARYGHQASRRNDGTYEIAPGWGPAKGILFEGNHYFGRNIDRPEEGLDTTERLPQTLSFASGEPAFDPAHPELFDGFIARHREWIMHLFAEQFGKPPSLGK
jgi:Right handed beta helix region